jgi:hypothetical protein
MKSLIKISKLMINLWSVVQLLVLNKLRNMMYLDQKIILPILLFVYLPSIMELLMEMEEISLSKFKKGRLIIMVNNVMVLILKKEQETLKENQSFLKELKVKKHNKWIKLKKE